MKLKAYSFTITWMIFLSLLISCTKDKVTYIAPPNCPDTISFNSDILPLIQNNCTGCHDIVNGT